MANQFLDAALALAARGLPVFPIEEGCKFPPRVKFKAAATTDETQIRMWWARWPESNIGVYTNAFVVVDVDNKHGHFGSLSHMEAGLSYETFRVATPSDGWHDYHLGPSVAPCIAGDGLDVKSDGSYVLGPGSYLDPENPKNKGKGGWYRIDTEAPMLPLPEAFRERLSAPRPGVTKTPPANLDNEADVAAAIEYLEAREPAVFGQHGDQHTYETAAGVFDFAISEDKCLDLMLDHFNERCDPPWEPDDLAVKVRSGLESRQNQWGVKSPAAAFEGVNVEPAEYRPRPKTKWLRAWEPEDEEVEDEWLFYDRLPRRGTALLVAPSGAGKTFLATQLAISSATGTEFLGVAPDDRCAAIVLAAEGVSGLNKRLRVHGGRPAISAMKASFLGDPESIKSLVKDLEAEAKALQERCGLPLGLIVVDTIAASGLIKDENSNTECAAAVKVLELLSDAFNCLVVALHHPPKNGTGARGGSALHAGFDTVFEIFRDNEGPVRFVECTKGRDAPTGKWGSFTLTIIPLKPDSRGRAKTTCVVSMGQEKKRLGKDPAYSEVFMESFDGARVAVGAGKEEPVSRQALRDEFGGRTRLTHKSNHLETAFKKCLAWAEASHRVRVQGYGADALISDQRPPIGEDQCPQL